MSKLGETLVKEMSKFGEKMLKFDEILSKFCQNFPKLGENLVKKMSNLGET